MCVAIGLSAQESFGSSHVTRNANAWASGAITRSSQESWGTYPSISSTDYQFQSQQPFFDGPGRMVAKLEVYQYVEAPGSEYGSSANQVIDYAYDPDGKLVTSTTRYRYAELNGPASGEAVSHVDTYFVDSRGSAFVASVDSVNLGYTQDPTAFQLYPDGTVKSYSITQHTCGGGCHEDVASVSYDESGEVVQSYSGLVNRFGDTYEATTTNIWLNGKLATVEAASSGSHLTTVYWYDPAGNNTLRTTTNSSGALQWAWTGVYDTAGNLLCERSVDAAGALLSIIHYDYGCF